jgi:hypothetical protein
LDNIHNRDNEPRKGVPLMINVICDSCKKAIPDAQKDVNVFYVLDKTLCKSCEGKINEAAAEQMSRSKSYSIKQFHDKYIKEMQRRCK